MRGFLLFDVLVNNGDGAPLQLPSKQLGDHSAPPKNWRRMLGYFLRRIIRLSIFGQKDHIHMHQECTVTKL